MRLKPRHYLVISVLAIVLILWVQQKKNAVPSIAGLACAGSQGVRIAVYEGSGFHDDVAGSVVYSAILSGAQVIMYRRGWRFGFEKILQKFYPGETRHPDKLPNDIKSGEFDVLFAVSCDQRWIGKDVLAAIQTTPSIQVMCMHHEMLHFEDHRNPMREIAREGRLTMLTLAEHTRRAGQYAMSMWNRKDNMMGWEKAGLRTFTSVFPYQILQGGPDLPQKKGKYPSKVAILGDLASGRRRFKRVFEDLSAALKENPKSLGYVLGEQSHGGAPIYNPIPAQGSPLSIHLFGSDKGEIDIPQELRHIINLHAGLSYVDYYELLQRMDVIVPAWENEEYWYKRASAGIYVGINARIPTLISPPILEAYPFLDPIAYELAPYSWSEVEHITRLRNGTATWPKDITYLTQGIIGQPIATRRGLSAREQSREWSLLEYKLQKDNVDIFCDVFADVTTRTKRSMEE